MKIIYLHGFASIGNSDKSAALRAKFGAENVAAPDLPVDPDEVESIVNQIISQNTSYPVIFVGTSLGGFWAHYFSQKWDAPCVIVNPATNPSVLLRKYIDAPAHNYYKNTPVPVTEKMLEGYAAREAWLQQEGNTNGSLINMFVATDDAVIDHKFTRAALPHTKLYAVMPNGGHRFMAHWDKVVAAVAGIMKK